MGQIEDLKEEEARLTKIIEESHCGYCKQVVSGARDILHLWNAISDKAVEMDRLQHEGVSFLTETNAAADKMLTKYKPVQNANEAQGYVSQGRIGNMIQRPLNRLKSNNFAQQWLGDYLNGIMGP